jgi:hypothetical protein
VLVSKYIFVAVGLLAGKTKATVPEAHVPHRRWLAVDFGLVTLQKVFARRTGFLAGRLWRSVKLRRRGFDS